MNKSMTPKPAIDTPIDVLPKSQATTKAEAPLEVKVLPPSSAVPISKELSPIEDLQARFAAEPDFAKRQILAKALAALIAAAA